MKFGVTALAELTGRPKLGPMAYAGLKRACLTLLLGVLAVSTSQTSQAQDRLVEVRFTPTERAQIAIWIETADGEFLQTIRLTESTAYRGIGNRPGALQMNSGFHWPYGRREGVLPVWAHRRVTTQAPFKRVIFQDRLSEGFASRTSNDASVDDYFCLSFNQSTTTREALDAVTCASVFNSDKGRYLTEDDVAAGYAEPFEAERGASVEMRNMDTNSLYPPRRDLPELRGSDHPDVVDFAADARVAMPEIDAVTMATLQGDLETMIQFDAPLDWPDGEYVIYVEVNVEGDYNSNWDDSRFPTPILGDSEFWDFWAKTYGYPYRGQPSVVFQVPFQLNSAGGIYTVTDPNGYGSAQGESSEMTSMDGSISNDPVGAPGSGADRLLAGGDGNRLSVTVVPSNVCGAPEPPPQCFAECDASTPCDSGFVCTEDNECLGECDVSAQPNLFDTFTVLEHEEKPWEYATVSFTVPSSMRDLQRYEVRVATEAFEEGMSFGSWGVEAKIADLEDIALVVPVDGAVGDVVTFDLGHLNPQTRYFIGMRAVDKCNSPSDVVSQELVTSEIIFTTVSPCFVATAAYGTPLAEEIGVLRRFRDRHLLSNSIGRFFVETYYEVGPGAADVIRDNAILKDLTRSVLGPIVSLVSWLQ